MKAVEGLEWGQLKIIRMYKGKYVFPQGGGWQTCDMCEIECSCGEKFEIDADDIDQRILQACKKCQKLESTNKINPANRLSRTGRTGLPGRPRFGKQRRVSTSVTMLPEVLEWLQNRSYEKRMSLSAFAGKILEQGMKSEESEEVEK